MKPVLLIVAIMAVAFAEKPRRYDGEQVLKITPAHHDHLKKLWHLRMNDTRLDFWTAPRSLSHPVDVRVPKEIMKDFKNMLDDNQMEYTVMIDDLQQLIDNETATMKNYKKGLGFAFEQYHSYEEIEAFMDELASDHDGVSVKTLIQSVEGRDIKMLMIGDGSKPVVFVMAGQHAREWIGPAIAAWIANEVLTGKNGLKDKFDFFIIPVVNVDGYVYTREHDRMWRKNRRVNEGIVHCVGVDPNRNFDSNHCGEGSSTNPCADTYCGPTPFSEPCTQAVRDAVTSVDNVAGLFDLHSYSQLVMSAYGYTKDLPSDFDAMRQAMDAMAEAIHAEHNHNYGHGAIAPTIYVASGGIVDWAYDAAGVTHSYNIECRPVRWDIIHGFLLPEDQIIPNAEEVWAGMLVWAKQY